MPVSSYYRADLARIHHEGFGFHADAVAPGIVSLLEPVREQGGLVVEIGCGSGLLTRYLVEAGHRVVATDASQAMLDLARDYVPGVEATRQLCLPDDPVPSCDAIVSVGHVLSYLDDEAELFAAVTALAGAVRAGGMLAFDICDLAWGEARRDQSPRVWATEDWLLVTRTSLPATARYRRDMTTFVRQTDELWRRDHEVHDNVLIDTAEIPGRLAEVGIAAERRASFGTEVLPTGLVVILGRKPTGTSP